MLSTQAYDFSLYLRKMIDLYAVTGRIVVASLNPVAMGTNGIGGIIQRKPKVA